MALLSRRFTLLALVAAACQRAPAPPPAPTASTSASKPDATPAPPSAAECEALFSRYHGLSPDDSWVSRESFVARCQKSEHAVLGCLERARDEVRAIVRQGRAEVDAGDEPPEEQLVSLLMRVALPSRFGICAARERVRFALRSGELAALAREPLQPGEHGVAVVRGSWATLPSRGLIESTKTVELSPPGEVRVSKRPDGRIWIYFLGALLGRHQNQVGFVYSSRPFVPADFRAEDEICLEPSREDGASGPEPKRYMLSCFTLVDRLAPQLIEVGSAPD